MDEEQVKKSIEQYLDALTTPQKIAELQHLTTKFFLTGVRGDVTSGLNCLELSLRSPDPAFDKLMADAGQPVYTPQEYHVRGMAYVTAVAENYDKLPFETLEDNPLHNLLQDGKRYAQQLGISAHAFDAAPSRDRLTQTKQWGFALARDVGNPFAEGILYLKSELKKETGRDFAYSPNCSLRPNRKDQLV